MTEFSIEDLGTVTGTAVAVWATTEFAKWLGAGRLATWAIRLIAAITALVISALWMDVWTPQTAVVAALNAILATMAAMNGHDLGSELLERLGARGGTEGVDGE